MVGRHDFGISWMSTSAARYGGQPSYGWPTVAHGLVGKREQRWPAWTGLAPGAELLLTGCRGIYRSWGASRDLGGVHWRSSPSRSLANARRRALSKAFRSRTMASSRSVRRALIDRPSSAATTRASRRRSASSFSVTLVFMMGPDLARYLRAAQFCVPITIGFERTGTVLVGPVRQLTTPARR